MQSVVIVLKSHGKLGGHKKQSVEFVGILSAGDSGEILGLSIGIGIHPSSVIAVPVDMLRGHIRNPGVLALRALTLVTN